MKVRQRRQNLCWQNFIEQYSLQVLKALRSASPLHRYRLFCSSCYTERYTKGILLSGYFCLWTIKPVLFFITTAYNRLLSVKQIQLLQFQICTKAAHVLNSSANTNNVYVSRVSGVSAVHPSCSQYFCFKVCLTSKLISTRWAIYLALSYVRTQGNRATPLSSPSVSHPSR